MKVCYYFCSYLICTFIITIIISFNLICFYKKLDDEKLQEKMGKKITETEEEKNGNIKYEKMKKEKIMAEKLNFDDNKSGNLIHY